MAAAEEGQEEPKKKSKLPLIIGALVVLALGGGGGWYFMGGAKPADEEEEKVVNRDVPKKTSFVTLEPFTFNLLDEDQDRFAQIGLVLEVNDAEVEAELKALEPAVRNALLLLMSSKTSRTLLSVRGKQDLGDEIVDATNAILAGEPAPPIKMPRKKSKKALRLKRKAVVVEKIEQPEQSIDGDEDEYESDEKPRRSRRSRRREPVIPERVYATHFANFLVQ